MPFEEILGQERAIRLLTGAIAGDTLPHAYLFYGAEGVGRFKTAVALTQSLMCERGERRGACGTCPPCRRVASEGHPDLFVVRPKSREGPKAKEWEVDPESGTIRIEQIRDFQRWIAVRSFEGGWRVGIFEGADKMNAQASNALLKTLEEPPAQSLLVLISPTRDQLLPTIVSRCQLMYFAPLPQEEVEAFLSGRQEVPKERLSLISALSGGSLGKALQIDPDWVVTERRDWIDRLNELVEIGPEGSLLGFADDLVRSNHLLDVLDLYESWFRDLLLYRVDSPERIVNTDYLEKIAAACEELNPAEAIFKVDSIRQARRDIQGPFNLNRQMIMEGLLLNLCERGQAFRIGDKAR